MWMSRLMRRLMACALVMACALAGVSAAAQADGASGAGDIQPVRNIYKMDMELDTQDKVLRERISLAVVNDSADEWSEIYLRDFMDSVLAEDDVRNNIGLNEYDGEGNLLYAGPTMPPDSRHLNGSSGIISARQDGAELAFAADIDDPSIVRVQLSKPVAPGGCTMIELEYEAAIPAGGYRCAWSLLGDDIDLCATYELAQFYPMLAIYEDGEWICDPYFIEGECFYTRCADFDITLRAPEEFEVIASGDETRGATADGITEWQITARNMRDATIIVSNELECVSGERGGVKVNSYFARPVDGMDDEKTQVVYANDRKQGELSLEAAMDSIEAFEAAYGEYPYAELDVVESSYEFGGMEAPGLVRISQLYSWSLGDDASEDEREYYTNGLCSTVAHEVAHEWFYGVVGDNQFREAWLDESFAAYSEQVYWRAQGRGEDEIAAVMKELAAMGHTDQAVDKSYDEMITGTGWDYTNAVYRRGAAFLYGLEQAIGQEKFAEFMRGYYAEFSFDEVTTRDFLEAIEPYVQDSAAARELIDKYLSQAA